MRREILGTHSVFVCIRCIVENQAFDKEEIGAAWQGEISNRMISLRAPCMHSQGCISGRLRNKFNDEAQGYASELRVTKWAYCPTMMHNSRTTTSLRSPLIAESPHTMSHVVNRESKANQIYIAYLNYCRGSIRRFHANNPLIRISCAQWRLSVSLKLSCFFVNVWNSLVKAKHPS